MTQGEREEMFSYYDAPADGYEDFYRGQGPPAAYDAALLGLQVRKKYFERAELESLLARQGFGVTAVYGGQAFVAALATKEQRTS